MSFGSASGLVHPVTLTLSSARGICDSLVSRAQTGFDPYELVQCILLRAPASSSSAGGAPAPPRQICEERMLGPAAEVAASPDAIAPPDATVGRGARPVGGGDAVLALELRRSRA